MYLKIISLSALVLLSGLEIKAQTASAIQANGSVVQLSLSRAVEIALLLNRRVLDVVLTRLRTDLIRVT